MIVGLLIANPIYAVTITVNDLGDALLEPNNNGNCTLREAIEAAEDDAAVDACVAGSGADTIVFDPTIIPQSGTSILLESDLSGFNNDAIRESLTIAGPGADLLIIDGDDNYRMFTFDSLTDDQVFNLSGINLFQAEDNTGAAIFVQIGETLNLRDMRLEANTATSATTGGGAITSNGSSDDNPNTINIERSSFIGNRANSAGGAISTGVGNNIVIKDSTFLENRALDGSDGGAISVLGLTNNISNLKIIRSTFSKNRTDRSGGAIFLLGAGLKAEIEHSTITDNTANADMVGGGSAGGIYLDNSAGLTLTNSIVAGNNAFLSNTEDMRVGPSTIISSNGFNLIGNNQSASADFPAGTPNVNGDYVGTSAAKLDPELDSIDFYGGSTRTHQPLSNSFVIDKGSCALEPFDQRGLGNDNTKMRIVDDAGIANGVGSDGCDIGSVEFGGEEITPLDTEICVPIKASNNNVAVVCL